MCCVWVWMLKKDNTLLREQIENSKGWQRNECKICMDAVLEVAFLPCGHTMSCKRCAASLQSCPVCGEPISDALKIYVP